MAIIEVKNLSKRYYINHQRGGYLALRDILTNAFSKPLNYFNKNKNTANTNKNEEFWALKDLNFTVEAGEVVGIIGANGAGKSTLLKILSQITPPTTGEIKIKGRVGSLLEVGTGFHPELTGRENIFLNGAILGMSEKEIRSKFEQIVEFAGINKFLDTPVKYYSSGMYVRLAFAVAAHLEPDILIVDEVLAVGDMEFQKKCLGKMDEITKKEGRTILFVSHNLEAVEQLCQKCILLENGQMKLFGKTKDVINKYLNYQNNLVSEWINNNNNFDNNYFTPLRFFTSNKEGNLIKRYIGCKEAVEVNIELNIKQVNSLLTIGYTIYNEDNVLLYWTYHTDTINNSLQKIDTGHYLLKSKIPNGLLNEGIYRIELIASIHFKEWIFEPQKNNPTIYLEIKGGFSDSPLWNIKRPGINAPIINWQIEKI